jgi:hypothetical protein
VTRARRRLLVTAAVTLGACAIERGLAVHVAGMDPLAAALTGRMAGVLATAVPLLLLHVLLALVAPCVCALALARAVLDRD